MNFPVDIRTSTADLREVKVQVDFSQSEIDSAYSDDNAEQFRTIFFDPAWDALSASEKLATLSELAKLVEQQQASNLNLKGGTVVQK